MRYATAIFLSFIVFSSALAQSDKGRWCGYALIEGVPNIESTLPMISLIAPDDSADKFPDELFQMKQSLDGTKAIVEACWKIFPSKEVVLNLLSLGGNEKEKMDAEVTYSLFVPGGTREESAASVRQYLSEHIKEWETQEG